MICLAMYVREDFVVYVLQSITICVMQQCYLFFVVFLVCAYANVNSSGIFRHLQ